MRTIEYSTYYDKVYGGWIGKCIGGNIGADVENNKYLLNLDESEIFPETIPPNDDLDLQLLWLQVLENKGINLRSRDLAEAWEKYCWYPFNEYGYFLHNFERHIAPPVSGKFNNQYFSRSMGSPIRSEIWGMISAGHSELAMEYAYKDSTLDHETESLWSEQMLAAMEAEAFFESDISQLIDFGLAKIPEESQLKQCIQYVRKLYADGFSWQQAREKMLANFGDPDASKAVQNLALTMLALLYGENDFGKTQLIALNCGYDTDCTCATAGAILGIVFGASQLPEDWKIQAKDTFAIGIDVQRPTNRISDLATDTCRVGVAVAKVLLTGLNITGVPLDLDWERIPFADPREAIDISVDYLGEPSISPEVPKTVALTVENVSHVAKKGTLRLRMPESCAVSPSLVELEIEPVGRFVQPITVRFNPGTTNFATSVSVSAVWEENGKQPIEYTIGLAVAQPYLLIGPFWDLYDTTAEGAESYYDPIHRRKGRPRDAEHFNNYINIDKPYIPESTFQTLPEGGRTVYAAEHKLPVDGWIGTAGPACVYLVRDVVMPEEREVRFMIGNSDGFKLWVNDELVKVTRDPWYWMPYNHAIVVKLHKGLNRIVTKLIRRGGTCDFSIGLTIPETNVRWMNDYETILIS